MDELSIYQIIALAIIPVLFAITLHEAAHGYVAFKLGDKTAYQLGRISLNPIKHMDMVGTVIVPILLLITTQFFFGWAKPVPINTARLKHPKRDAALVALAGPLANLLMTLLWCGILKLSLFLVQSKVSVAVPLGLMSQIGIGINLALMVLNLLPIPPLDGSRVLASFLPLKWDRWYNQITPFGFLIVLIMAITGILSSLLFPAILFIQKNLLLLFHL